MEAGKATSNRAHAIATKPKKRPRTATTPSPILTPTTPKAITTTLHHTSQNATNTSHPSATTTISTISPLSTEENLALKSRQDAEVAALTHKFEQELDALTSKHAAEAAAALKEKQERQARAIDTIESARVAVDMAETACNDATATMKAVLDAAMELGGRSGSVDGSLENLYHSIVAVKSAVTRFETAEANVQQILGLPGHRGASKKMASKAI